MDHEAIKHELIEENEQFRQLYEEHREYEGKLDQFNERDLLSPEDESEVKRIKLHKLALKDQMELMIRSHAASV